MILQISIFRFTIWLSLFIFLLLGCKTEKKIQLKVKKIPQEILLGDTIYLEWEVANADTIMFFPSGEQLDLKGSMISIPDTNIRYLFKAYKGKQRTSKGYSVKVKPPEIYVRAPADVIDEDSFVVSWTTLHAEYIKIFNKKYPANGEAKLKLDSSQKVDFFVYNKNGIVRGVSKNIFVRQVEDFKYTAEVKKGETAFIQWKFKSTKKVIIPEFKKEFKAKDTVRFVPEKTADYTIIAIRNKGDTLIKKVNIEVRVPGIRKFYTNNYIFKGQDAYLNWQTDDPDSVNIPGIKYSLPANGRVLIRPDSTKVYTLNFYKYGKVQQAKCTLNVINNRKLITGSVSYSQVPKKMRLDFEIYATDLSKYPDSVKLFVLVVDTIGNFVCDLAPPFGNEQTAKRFFKELVESNARNKNMKVKNFRVVEVHDKADIPMDVNLTLDYSGSMYGAISNLGKAFQYYVEHKQPRTQVSVVRFDDSLALEVPLTADKNVILNSVKNPTDFGDFGGSTALYAAADEGLRSLENSKNSKLQILFTDGYENSSFAYFGQRAIFAQEVAKKAKKIGARISVIAFGSSVNRTLLKFLTAITEGTYYEIFKASDIQKVMKEILYTNRNYYLITYKPMLSEGDNSITLSYDNNIGQISKTERKVFVGDNFNLDEFEDTPSGSYWKGLSQPKDKNGFTSSTKDFSNSKWAKMRKTTLPQAVAWFDFNKTDLKQEHYPKIAPFIDALKKNPNRSVVIFGHTDLVGTEQSCDELSKNRAISVKNYLINNGIEESRIFYEACGKSFPVWNVEDTPVKAAENRRVELMLVE